jgi:hypothetical protein
MCAWVGNQWSRGVVTAWVRTDTVQSLHHQRRDLHQSTYPVPLGRSGLILLSGVTGHFAWQCPTRSTARGAGNQEKPQGQQNFMYGRVNHMTSDEAQEAQDVVLGMFLTNLHPATILFNSRASHSFISSSFVTKHSLPIATMKHTMLVSSPGGEMRTKHICPTVSITIRGGRVSVEPHPLRLQGYRHHTWHGLVKQV